jgi:hypothetical protein
LPTGCAYTGVLGVLTGKNLEVSNVPVVEAVQMVLLYLSINNDE